jgi:hypothetical protein
MQKLQEVTNRNTNISTDQKNNNGNILARKEDMSEKMYGTPVFYVAGPLYESVNHPWTPLLDARQFAESCTRTLW